MKKICHLIVCSTLMYILTIVPTTTSNQFIPKDPIQSTFVDYDPLVDLNITVDIIAIRALDTLDLLSDPDFFVKVYINEAEFISQIWENTSYVYNGFSTTIDVPDDDKTMDIRIQLWENDGTENEQCDISKEPNINGSGLDVQMTYDVSNGRWSGDNNNADVTGYGRISGWADGSQNKDENDCEMWFSIHQNDFDNDTLPYWIETNVYGTDPTLDDTGSDADADEVPIEWEHRYGFNPFVWDDHRNIDPDRDSINNLEEYQTYSLGSDPFRKDVFLEIDYMFESNGEIRNVTQEAIELTKTPFHRRNIVFHFDTGQLGGGEIVPFDDDSSFEEIRLIWNDYFLHNDSNNWRRGVFHYAIFVHDQTPKGYGFSGDVSPYWGYNPGTNSFAIANTLVQKKAKLPLKSTAYITASLIIHEMGHNFGIRFGEPFGCDNRLTGSPLKLGWYIWGNYKSIMNYRYTYSILDYSDGSHGKIDYDDWENIDLTYFEKPK